MCVISSCWEIISCKVAEIKNSLNVLNCVFRLNQFIQIYYFLSGQQNEYKYNLDI